MVYGLILKNSRLILLIFNKMHFLVSTLVQNICWFNCLLCDLLHALEHGLCGYSAFLANIARLMKSLKMRVPKFI